MQSVTLANHRAPVSLAASVFSIGELMLTVTGLILVRDPRAWIVSDPSQVIAIVYAVRHTQIPLLQTFCNILNAGFMLHLRNNWSDCSYQSKADLLTR